MHQTSVGTGIQIGDTSDTPQAKLTNCGKGLLQQFHALMDTFPHGSTDLLLLCLDVILDILDSQCCLIRQALESGLGAT